MSLLATLAVGLALAAPMESSVAPCEKAIIGHGTADWRQSSVVAGPVGALAKPLRSMIQTQRGLVTKMPLLVEGRAPETVTVSVPPPLQSRVFLYYGRHSITFNSHRGYSEVEFELCGNKPRTIWPGGIRVKGQAPIRLNVFSEERRRPYVLRLGRPRVYEP